MSHIEMMLLAEKVAFKSMCKRAQVGAVLAHHLDGDAYVGYNQNPCGGACEGSDGRTLPEVLHAEAAAINNAYTYQADLGGWVLYVTRQPCINCARLIVAAGISAVYYRDADDKTDGSEHLLAHGVSVDSRWIKGQMRAQTLEQVQKTWADRSQDGYAVGDVVNVLGVDLRVVEVLEPHPSNLMPWPCDACPQRGDGVCCGGVR